MEDKIKVWLSFDFGITGSFEDLYKFLDSMNAVECGSDLSYFETGYKKGFIKGLKEEIKKNIELKQTDRIYVIINYKEKLRSGFLFGSQKRAFWEGYAQKQDNKLLLEDI